MVRAVHTGRIHTLNLLLKIKLNLKVFGDVEGKFYAILICKQLDVVPP